MLSFARLGECRTLAALFVVALLICHGALGGLHLSCAPSGGTAPAGAHAGAVHTTTHHATAPHGHEASPAAEGCPMHHGTGGEYYAALLGVILASALLLAIGARRRREARETGRPYWEALPISGPILPRGPTLPRLQVFRL